jgi:hypothetical protein
VIPNRDVFQVGHMILRKACLFVALLLLTSGLSGLILVVDAEQPLDSPTALVEIHNDYVVNTNEEIGIDNVTWLMKANILVYGTLYINNSHFTWDPLTDGGLRIYVYNSGTLKMKDSNMTANDTTTKQTNDAGFFWTYSYGIHWNFYFEVDKELRPELHVWWYGLVCRRPGWGSEATQ